MTGKRVQRLQGTDGVRRTVAPSSGFSSGPLETFLKKEAMTEEFFELYCYCHVASLINRGVMREGEEVLIGWDSRDVEKFYTSKAVSGISKAGGKPAILGAIPTPGVALALSKRKASAAFMITASHNPADQNGIKIFSKPDGMKLLPEDDKALTESIFSADYNAVKSAVERHKPTELSSWGKEFFKQFHLDPRNSWVGEGEDVFSDTILVADTAFGATAGVAGEIFRDLGFFRVVEKAAVQNGKINENSGVALLEGLKGFSISAVSENLRMAEHHLIKGLIDTAEEMKDEISSGKNLVGAVFDGDGDRFFLLPFDAESGEILILSGDECAAIQAEYLISTEKQKYEGSLFVHSIESDINVSAHARRLGFEPLITGVGDKWILEKAIGNKRKFGLGCEETGHSIHGGHLDESDSLYFAGNGVKGAINTLYALKKLSRKGRGLIELARKPFEPGYKKTAYSYYIDKSLFENGSKIWKGVEAAIAASFSFNAPKGFGLKPSFMESEPDMLYSIIEDGEGAAVGAVFVRNSGTEDKISVNLRGPCSLSSLLDKIAEDAVLYLMREIKDMGNRFAIAEKEILAKISKGEPVIKEDYAEVNFPRLITEMEIKQKLIRTVESGYKLTSLGEKFVG